MLLIFLLGCMHFAAHMKDLTQGNKIPVLLPTPRPNSEPQESRLPLHLAKLTTKTCIIIFIQREGKASGRVSGTVRHSAILRACPQAWA
jgi:hypothetical protein